MGTVQFWPAELILCSLNIGMGWTSMQGRSHSQAREQGPRDVGFSKRNTADKSQKAAPDLPARDSREGEKTRQRLLSLDS